MDDEDEMRMLRQSKMHQNVWWDKPQQNIQEPAIQESESEKEDDDGDVPDASAIQSVHAVSDMGGLNTKMKHVQSDFNKPPSLIEIENKKHSNSG